MQMAWRAELIRPVKPVGRPPLKTLADARAYLLELPDGTASLPDWRRAAELLLDAADDADAPAIRAATDQVERALFATRRLDLDHPPQRRATRAHQPASATLDRAAV
jgi:hypothetical protein